MSLLHLLSEHGLEVTYGNLGDSRTAKPPKSDRAWVVASPERHEGGLPSANFRSLHFLAPPRTQRLCTVGRKGSGSWLSLR